MKHISFAWTTQALLAGRKTCTCRDWEPEYANQFKAGGLVAAYDRSPRYKGKRIATLRLTHDATFGVLTELVPDAYEREGFAYYDEQVAAGNEKAIAAVKRGLHLPDGMTLRTYLDHYRWGEWIVRFDVVNFEPEGE